MSTTAIEWTDRVWNPVTGCTKVSQGCRHCYAEGVAERFWATQYPRVPTVDHLITVGHSVQTTRPRRFTDVRTHEDRLLEPLRWRKPAKVFVNSMSDLFHEDVPFDFIDRVFAVMALASHLTFQVLTKRPEVMRAYLACSRRRFAVSAAVLGFEGQTSRPNAHLHAVATAVGSGLRLRDDTHPKPHWPLRNVWLGVSVEDQTTAYTRVPLLLETPAAVRFVSYEPALAPVSFVPWLTPGAQPGVCVSIDGDWWHRPGECPQCRPALDWIIVGGESGPNARPFAMEWAEQTVRHGRAHGVPVFVKQLGAHVVSEGRSEVDHEGRRIWQWRAGLANRKGADMAEWPEDLRVRQFPTGGVR